MICLMILRFLITATACFFVFHSFTSSSFAQRSSRNLASQSSSCKVGGIDFTCPKGFVSLPVEMEQDLALLVHKSKSFGLFVVAPESDFDAKKLVADISKVALTKFFPKERQDFSWKYFPITDKYTDKNHQGLSKYEIGGNKANGFNGHLEVAVEYRQLKLNGKDFVIGYISEAGRGENAKQRFAEKFYDDGSKEACKGFVKLMYSITGETGDPNNLCTPLVTPAVE